MKKNDSNNPNKVLIIGMGNEFRKDDGVGIWIARKLMALQIPDVLILETVGDGTKLMEDWKDERTVIVFDAVHSQEEPGTIYRFDVHRDDIPKHFFRHSTHAFGLLEAVELSRTLNQLPSQMVIFGVEGNSYDAGTGLSPEVEKSAHRLIQTGMDEIHARKGSG